MKVHIVPFRAHHRPRDVVPKFQHCLAEHGWEYTVANLDIPDIVLEVMRKSENYDTQYSRLRLHFPGGRYVVPEAEVRMVCRNMISVSKDA